MSKFERERHVRYFAHSLRNLPSAYSNLDTNRLTLVHFAVHSLDLLGVLDDDAALAKLSVDRKSIIDWIYSLQTLSGPDDGGGGGSGGRYADHVGFKGGTFLGGADGTHHCRALDDDGHELATAAAGDDGPTATTPPPPTEEAAPPVRRRWRRMPYTSGFEYDHGHVAMTYTALCTLAALGDDLGRFDRRGVVEALKYLQRDDGSFQCISVGSEHDMRFLFCACAISHMLDDWSGVDADRAVRFVRNCRSYDGAFSLIPGQEGHGGSTFCAISALALMGKLDDVLAEDGWRDDLIQWCVSRQLGGMQGRPNKVEDTCYSYWIGGTLRLLGCERLLDGVALRDFVLSCQTDMGGFGKVKGAYPDLLHSFYSMAWLSLSSSAREGGGESEGGACGQSGGGGDILLNEMDCALGIRKIRTLVFELSTGS